MLLSLCSRDVLTDSFGLICGFLVDFRVFLLGLNWTRFGGPLDVEFLCMGYG